VGKSGGRSRLRAAVGTIAFVLAIPVPTILLVPCLLSGWVIQEPFLGSAAVRWVGVLLIVLGIPLPAGAMVRFVRQGLGTPAPWAPTDRLIVGGLYAHVRNPMYIGVVATIAGQGLLFGSIAVLAYAAVVLIWFGLFVRFYEEPHLTRVYGREYRLYCRRVNRWIPSLGRVALLVAVCCMPGIAPASRASSAPTVREPDPAPGLVVSGKVVGRKEIWDRRPNPLMGRPDILKEIDLQVDVSRVVFGDIASGADRIKVSIGTQEKLIKFKFLAEGWRGTFHLSGAKDPYELAEFTDGVAPPAKPRPGIAPVPPNTGSTLRFPDNVSGRQIKESPSLRERALKEIMRRYGMTGASVITLTSHSGPVPPPGGYVYWGVKGRIRGKWYIREQRKSENDTWLHLTSPE